MNTLTISLIFISLLFSLIIIQEFIVSKKINSLLRVFEVVTILSWPLFVSHHDFDFEVMNIMGLSNIDLLLLMLIISISTFVRKFDSAISTQRLLKVLTFSVLFLLIDILVVQFALILVYLYLMSLKGLKVYEFINNKLSVKNYIISSVLSMYTLVWSLKNLSNRYGLEIMGIGEENFIILCRKLAMVDSLRMEKYLFIGSTVALIYIIVNFSVKIYNTNSEIDNTDKLSFSFLLISFYLKYISGLGLNIVGIDLKYYYAPIYVFSMIFIIRSFYAGNLKNGLNYLFFAFNIYSFIFFLNDQALNGYLIPLFGFVFSALLRAIDSHCRISKWDDQARYLSELRFASPPTFLSTIFLLYSISGLPFSVNYALLMGGRYGLGNSPLFWCDYVFGLMFIIGFGLKITPLFINRIPNISLKSYRLEFSNDNFESTLVLLLCTLLIVFGLDLYQLRGSQLIHQDSRTFFGLFFRSSGEIDGPSYGGSFLLNTFIPMMTFGLATFCSVKWAGSLERWRVYWSVQKWSKI